MLQWVAEGLQSDEINERAAVFNPPFTIGRATITHYRKTRKTDIETIIAQDEHDALSSGLALRAERVKKLKALALRLERDLFTDVEDDYVWTDQVKSIGSGGTYEIVEYEEFNKAEIDAYRGLLDDIAKEMGDRKTQADITLIPGKVIELPMVVDGRSS